MKTFSLVIFLAVSLYGCTQNGRLGSVNIERLAFDTNKIAIFSWDTTLWLFPKNSSPTAISQGDLRLLDSLVYQQVNAFNDKEAPALYESFQRIYPIDSFLIRIEGYRFQYFPYEDVNGRRIVVVNCFKRNFPLWKQTIYSGRIHEGIKFIGIKFNLTDSTAVDLYHGGYM